MYRLRPSSATNARQCRMVRGHRQLQRVIFSAHLALILLVISLAWPSVTSAAPLRGWCSGNQFDVVAAWAGPAQGTVGVCGNVIAFHATQLQQYDERKSIPGFDTWKLQEWLQSGDTRLTNIRFRATFKIRCLVGGTTWSFNREWKPTVKDFPNEKFVQKWEPKFDTKELVEHSPATEFKAERGGGQYFVDGETQWTLRKTPCNACMTCQTILGNGTQ